jgi:hypothetical protein
MFQRLSKDEKWYLNILEMPFDSLKDIIKADFVPIEPNRIDEAHLIAETIKTRRFCEMAKNVLEKRSV